MYRPRFSKWQRLITRHREGWVYWRNITTSLALSFSVFGSLYYFEIGLEREQRALTRSPLSNEGPHLKKNTEDQKLINISFNSRLQQWEIYDQNQSLLQTFNGLYWEPEKDVQNSPNAIRPKKYKFQLPRNNNLHHFVQSLNTDDTKSFLISHLPEYKLKNLHSPLDHILKVTITRQSKDKNNSKALNYHISPLKNVLNSMGNHQDQQSSSHSFKLATSSFHSANQLNFQDLIISSYDKKQNNRSPSSKVNY